MSDIVKKLNATLRIDAINGSAFDREIVESQISEAIRYIETLEAQLRATANANLHVPIEGAAHFVVPNAIAELPASGPDGGKP